jgi:hypothetical protein
MNYTTFADKIEKAGYSGSWQDVSNVYHQVCTLLPNGKKIYSAKLIRNNLGIRPVSAIMDILNSWNHTETVAQEEQWIYG